jgi:hypothetical protein
VNGVLSVLFVLFGVGGGAAAGKVESGTLERRRAKENKENA